MLSQPNDNLKMQMDHSKNQSPRETVDSDTPTLGYKRETKQRIFVNRSLRLNTIKFFGFDMDYTLANYKSPQYEDLAFRILRDRLIEIGYPAKLAHFEYEPSFPARGLWFDTLYGTLLKIDHFGSILMCLRGFNTISHAEICELYPNKFLKYEESRIKIMSTLFDLPKLHLLACIVHMFQNNSEFKKEDNGVKLGSLYMSYKSIYEDVDQVTDWMHRGELKKQTVANLDYYVEKNPETLLMLDKLRKNGAKVFLLTNSDFQYSQAIMKHILEIPNHEGVVRKWTTYFDYIVTDARKPLFFEEGTILRVIDEATGRCSIGHHTGPLETGRIYAGGSCEVFTQLIRARGKDVLYTGDHIYGDILKSKKQVGWRTFLVIPELLNEIYVWKSKKALYDRLQDLDNRLAENYKNMDIGSASKPNVTSIQKEIRLVAQEMERSYGLLGSIFRSGSRLTFFSSQSMRYADIYSFSCINLIYYPMCYMFRAPTMLMPHESTVSHVDSPISSFAELEDYPCGLRRRAQTITVIPSNCLATSNLIEGDQPSKDDASALESADNL